jgi:hypothetical protein
LLTSSFLQNPDDTLFYAWGSFDGRLTGAAISTFASNSAGSARIVHIRQPRASYMYPLGGDRILGALQRPSDTAYFAIFDTSGALVRTVPLQLPGHDSIPSAERLRALARVHPCPLWQRKGFAMAYVNASRIILYDSLATPVRNFAVPFSGEERFVPNSETGLPEFVNDRWYYKACAFSKAHLFAVFSGKRVADLQLDRRPVPPVPGMPAVPPPAPGERGTPTAGKFVHVFDLSGKLVRVLELSAEVNKIVVDSAGSLMFATVEDEDSEMILRFRIPGIR